MSTATLNPSAYSVDAQQRSQLAASLTGYATIAAVAVMVAGVALIAADSNATLAFSLLILAITAICWKPKVGLHIIAFFALVGDADTMRWYPFTKNFSSRESIMFVANSLVMSPLEICLAATFGAWMLHTIAAHRRTFERGDLFGPIVALTSFFVLGLIRGLSSGGDRTAAIYEARALFYLPALYVLFTNLFTDKRSYRTLFGVIVAALTINSFFTISAYVRLTADEKARIESLGEHAASLSANVVILLLVAGWLYRTGRHRSSAALLVLMVPIGWAYVIAQRRAAIGALIVASIAVFAALFVLNRRRFWRVVPMLLLIVAAYTGAFWNSTSGLGFPAQAVKSIIAPDKISDKDRSSDFYRRIEAVDLVYTIRTDPIRGRGFGQRFLRPIPLPRISDFVTAEYQPHNSFLWIWIKIGVFGFISMLYFLGATVQRGVRAAVRLRDDTSVLVMVATLYTVMFATFTYLDISWDPRSMVMLASCASLIANIERLRGDDRSRSAV